MTDDAALESHLDDRGLWIPPDCRAFETQVVFRTPRATIQHFQPGNSFLGAYYGMIDESHFGDCEEMTDPKNPDLAPNRVTITPQGQDPITLEVFL